MLRHYQLYEGKRGEVKLSTCRGTRPSPRTSRTALPRERLRQVNCNVFGRLRLHAGFLQEPKILEPIDEPVLPGAVRNAIPIRQPAAHMAPIGERIARMTPIP